MDAIRLGRKDFAVALGRLPPAVARDAAFVREWYSGVLTLAQWTTIILPLAYGSISLSCLFVNACTVWPHWRVLYSDWVNYGYLALLFYTKAT